MEAPGQGGENDRTEAGEGDLREGVHCVSGLVRVCVVSVHMFPVSVCVVCVCVYVCVKHIAGTRRKLRIKASNASRLPVCLAMRFRTARFLLLSVGIA